MPTTPTSELGYALMLLKQAETRLYAMVEIGRKDCKSTLDQITAFLRTKEIPENNAEQDALKMAEFIIALPTFDAFEVHDRREAIRPLLEKYVKPDTRKKT